MKKKIISCILVLAVAVAFMPTSAFAASKVKMTAYDSVYKTGNTVYCAGAKGLYKVTLKKGKVKTAKVIWYMGDGLYSADSWLNGMKKKGKYIYFVALTDGSLGYLCRVKTSGKSKKVLASFTDGEYVLKGNKLYYLTYISTGYDQEKRVSYSMKLNGKSKKKVSKKVVMKHKRSNASKYRVIMKAYNGYAYDYLKTPKGTFLIGKTPLLVDDGYEDYYDNEYDY